MKQIHKNLLCALSLAASLLTASAESTFGKIAFMGDNVEINGEARTAIRLVVEPR